MTRVVSPKPRPPAARPEWLVGWLVGAYCLSNGVLVGDVVCFCAELNLDSVVWLHSILTLRIGVVELRLGCG